MLTLICSATSMVFADSWKDGSYKWSPPGLAKKGGMPPGIAKKFFDIDGYKWAEDAIERMAEKGVIKGIGNGLFAPKRSVTKLEAIVMALRIMGEEDEACAYLDNIKSGKREFKLRDYLQEWSYGYVALAEDKGILDEADVLYFKLNDPATRHEVAKYLVRAMGEEDEAQDHMDADLDFIDAPFIPQGSVGYIYIANDEGIIKGYEDKTFRPFRAVTRAEMAVMVSRLEGKVDDDDDEKYKIYEGEVTHVDDDYDWIKVDGKKFEILKNTMIIFEDNVKGSIKDIKVGDDVRTKVNDDEEAVYVKVDRDFYSVYKGEVEKIDDDLEWIKIDVGNKDVKFDIADDVNVVFKDDDGDLEDIEVGDEVQVKVNARDKIVYIKVNEENDTNVYSGSVFKIKEDDDEYEFWIYTSKVVKFEVDDDYEVEFDDEDGKITDLKIGDKIKVITEDGEVVELSVDRDIDEDIIDGTLYDLYLEEEMIAIKIDTQIKLYAIDDDTKIYLNNKKDQLSDLKKGDTLGLSMDDDEVIEVRAFRY